MQPTRLVRLLITLGSLRRCCAACLRYGRAASDEASFLQALRLREHLDAVHEQVSHMLSRLILRA